MKEYFTEALRTKVMSSPFLYAMWLGFFDKGLIKRRLPKSTDGYFVDGYPRSGNTFTKGLIQYCHPDLIANLHFYTIAPLKIALKHKLKILVLFRNPIDCVSSLILMEDFKIYKTGKGIDKTVSRRLHDYIRYYSYVLEKKENIQLLPFSKVITNEICESLECFFELPFAKTDWQEFKRINENVQKGKAAHFSMLPNEEKRNMKEDVKFYISESPKFTESKVIFKKLQASLYEDSSN